MMFNRKGDALARRGSGYTRPGNIGHIRDDVNDSLDPMHHLDPVGFPRLAAIRRIGLFPVCGVRRDVRPARLAVYLGCNVTLKRACLPRVACACGIATRTLRFSAMPPNARRKSAPERFAGCYWCGSRPTLSKLANVPLLPCDVAWIRSDMV
jgi:hypothetical protein